MPDENPGPIGDTEIFLAELDEIRRRRVLLGRGGGQLDAGTRPFDRNLTGLTFSGGGIRSACFSLGVAQAFARAECLSGFDYLSTVSGGGYFGGALSSLLGSTLAAPDAPAPARRADGDAFPFRLGVGGVEPEALSHLRSYSDFLTPEGGLGRLRLAAVLIRGVVLNAYLFLPWILAAVVVTQIDYELELRLGVTRLAESVTLVLVAASLALLLTFPLVVRLARGHFTWPGRNRYELLLARAVAVSVVALAMMPINLLIRTVVRASWPMVREQLRAQLATLDRWPVWAALAGVTVLWLAMRSRVRWVTALSRTVGRAALWLLGPAMLVGTYLLLCARFVHLPYVAAEFRPQPAVGVADSLVPGPLPSALRTAIDVRLGEEGGKLSEGARIVRRPDAGGLWIRDSIARPRRGWDWLTGPPDGPAGAHGVSLFPLAVTTNDTGGLHVIVTLRSFPEPHDVLLLLIFLVVVAINSWVVDVNVTSLHEFYRDRLSKAFLLRRDGNGIVANDRQRLSDLNASGVAPYHLINATVNVSGSTNPLVRGRNADFFLFSKLFTGSACTGYCTTSAMEKADPRFDLASATAISGAAAGPRMGVDTVDSVAGDMTFLNFRLGYWLPNPARVALSSTGYGYVGPGPKYLMREAFGMLDERARFVNVSDGGNIENLGVYQLLRRRCRTIVAVDAESDPALTCDAIATLIRYARIDLGIVIEIDLAPLGSAGNGRSALHWATGIIKYDNHGTDIGQIIYLKTSLTGDENEYVTAYGRQSPVFPQESTADQFFDEVHFEVYRALGDHVASGALNDAGAIGALLRSIGGSTA